MENDPAPAPDKTLGRRLKSIPPSAWFGFFLALTAFVLTCSSLWICWYELHYDDGTLEYWYRLWLDRMRGKGEVTSPLSDEKTVETDWEDIDNFGKYLDAGRAASICIYNSLFIQWAGLTFAILDFLALFPPALQALRVRRWFYRFLFTCAGLALIFSLVVFLMIMNLKDDDGDDDEYNSNSNQNYIGIYFIVVAILVQFFAAFLMSEVYDPADESGETKPFYEFRQSSGDTFLQATPARELKSSTAEPTKKEDEEEFSASELAIPMDEKMPHADQLTVLLQIVAYTAFLMLLMACYLPWYEGRSDKSQDECEEESWPFLGVNCPVRSVQVFFTKTRICRTDDYTCDTYDLGDLDTETDDFESAGLAAHILVGIAVIPSALLTLLPMTHFVNQDAATFLRTYYVIPWLGGFATFLSCLALIIYYAIIADTDEVPVMSYDNTDGVTWSYGWGFWFTFDSGFTAVLVVMIRGLHFHYSDPMSKFWERVKGGDDVMHSAY
ncbi:hypothetical protein CYMTET_51484 [Cymbomonas tetramitiformis]|uniref:Uncharacterized protein n=1 Tax=Cymbomonas tetramitiformis TaxID=36881 RepID=A0AAE0ES28_9CHLO|nr:hypothetical protein CYMTET_51484 [Cymbomonas tetramitiformis]